MSLFQLHLLGPISLARDGQIVRGFESQKALALVCYLAAVRMPQARGQLAELFWEGKAPERARQPEPHAPQRHPAAPRLSRGHPSGDRPRGARAADGRPGQLRGPAGRGDRAALGEAASLYRGEFLDGLYVDSGAEFEHWLAVQRETWHQRYVQLLHRLVDAAAREGQLRAGIG